MIAASPRDTVVRRFDENAQAVLWRGRGVWVDDPAQAVVFGPGWAREEADRLRGEGFHGADPQPLAEAVEEWTLIEAEKAAASIAAAVARLGPTVTKNHPAFRTPVAAIKKETLQ